MLEIWFLLKAKGSLPGTSLLKLTVNLPNNRLFNKLPYLVADWQQRLPNYITPCTHCNISLTIAWKAGVWCSPSRLRIQHACIVFVFILISSSFLFFWRSPVACGILVSGPGIKPSHLHRKHGVLTTGPLGEVLYWVF